jgi:4-alpha-glucanotransferase
MEQGSWRVIGYAAVRRRLRHPVLSERVSPARRTWYTGRRTAMPFPRTAGLLLHPTCLSGGHGIGDVGREAYRFVEFLGAAGMGLWQVLPLGPTGFGDSPYQPFSAFAGNHLLISLETLAEEGLLASSDLPGPTRGPVDYGHVVPWKLARLKQAFRAFREKAPAQQKDRFGSFCGSLRNRCWLEDYALFRALKEANEDRTWTCWDPDLVARKPEAVEHWARRLSEDVLFHKWLQYQFFRQWGDLKAYANQNGIKIVGDVPIFVSHDSADVWSNRELFHLDDAGRPTCVAGVPPDYFSSTGQLWGNPLYRWDLMARTRYRWWIDRLGVTLATVDVVRLDHFRGFEAYWEVQAGEPTAEKGRWVPAPGEELFATLARALGRLPIIAENLGVITPPVEAMRRRFGFPGMCVLQFGLADDASSVHLPHNLEADTVTYTGTHDNDTTLGWYRTLPETERLRVDRYLGPGAGDVPWSVVRLAMSTVADVAILPLQDVLGIGPEGRMNFPGKPSGNWTWRVKPGTLTSELSRRLRDLAGVFGR